MSRMVVDTVTEDQVTQLEFLAKKNPTGLEKK